jgi:hypothetical protein
MTKIRKPVPAELQFAIQPMGRYALPDKAFIGNIAVDSGMILFVDPRNAKNVDFEIAREVANVPHLPEEKWGQIGRGVVSGAGIDRGLFPVFQIIRHGRMVAIEIQFREDEPAATVRGGTPR